MLKDDLSSSLRSFKDSLAFSFQTLNLTLASLNNTIRSTSASGHSFIGSMYQAPTTMIPSDPRMSMLGSVDPRVFQNQRDQSLSQLFFGRPNYNVNPLEYYANRDVMMGNKLAGIGLSVGGATANAFGGSWGYTAGAALGSMILPGIGTIAGGLGGAILGSGIADPFVGAAQRQMADTNTFSRMSTRFSQGGFTQAQSQVVAQGMHNLGYNELMTNSHYESKLGDEGYRNVALLGMQANMLHGTNEKDLINQVKNLGDLAKFTTQMLGSKDVKETMQALKKLKEMGMDPSNNSGTVRDLLSSAYSYSKQMGVQANGLLQTAMEQSSAVAGQYGGASYLGIAPALRNMAYTSELEKRRLLSNTQLASVGGAQAMGGQMLQTQAALLHDPRQGQLAVMAGMTSTGGFNLNNATNAINSGYFGMVGSAAANFFGGGLDSMYGYEANKTELTTKMQQAFQGKGDSASTEFYRKMILNMAENYPGFQGASTQTKENIIASILMNQYGTPEATAHAFAKQCVYYRKSLSNRSRVETRGMLSMSGRSGGIINTVDSVATMWDRFTGTIGHAVGDVGRGMGNTLQNFWSHDNGSIDLSGGTLANSTAFNNYDLANRMGKSYGGGKKSGMYNTLNAEDFSLAYDSRAKRDIEFTGNDNSNPNGTKSSSRGWFDWARAWSSNRAQDYQQVIMSNANSYLGYGYKLQSGQDVEKLGEVRNNLMGALGNTELSKKEVADFIRQGSGGTQNTSSAILLPLLSEMLTSHKGNNVESMFNNVAKNGPYGKLNMSNMYDQFASEGMDKMTANQKFFALQSNAEVARYAQAHGLDVDTFAGQMAAQGSTFGSADSSVAFTAGANLRREMGLLASDAGVLKDANTMSRYDKARFYSSGGGYTKLLDAANMSGEEFSSIKWSENDVNAAAKNIALSLQGSDKNVYNANSNMAKISDPNVQRLVGRLTSGQGKDKFLESLDDDTKKKLLAGGTDAEAIIKQRMLIPTIGGASGDQIRNSLETLGVKVDEETLSALREGGDSSGIIAKKLLSGELHGDTNAMHDTVAQLQELEKWKAQGDKGNFARADILEAFKKQGYNENDGEALYKFAQQSIIGGSIAKPLQDKKDALASYKTAIDTIVEGSGTFAYGKVKIVADYRDHVNAKTKENDDADNKAYNRLYRERNGTGVGTDKGVGGYGGSGDKGDNSGGKY